MSQSGTLSVTLPPGATTSFQTDSGSATPAANIIKFVTAGSGTQGISTSGAGNTVTITLDNTSVSGTGSTVGAVTADIITFACGATPGTYQFDIRVSGFESTTPAGCGYSIQAAVRTTGAAATLIQSNDIVTFEEAALASCSAALIVSGNNAIVRVTGTVGLTVSWSSDAQYTFAS